MLTPVNVLAARHNTYWRSFFLHILDLFSCNILKYCPYLTHRPFQNFKAKRKKLVFKPRERFKKWRSSVAYHHYHKKEEVKVRLAARWESEQSLPGWTFNCSMCACVCMCTGASVLRSAAACPVFPTGGQTRDTLPYESGFACGWVLRLGFYAMCMFCSDKKVSRYKEPSDSGFERLRAAPQSRWNHTALPPNCSFWLVGDE